MLLIHCVDHLRQVRAFAESLGPKAVESLERCLYRYADDPNKLVSISGDPAPHSFYFTVSTLVVGASGVEWRFWYNGGIIFWDKSNGWQIHT